MNESKSADWPVSAYTVCGLVLLSHADRFSELSDQLLLIPNLDIHSSDSNSRFAITIEEYPGTRLITERIEEIRQLPGVVDISLAYTQSEPIG